MRRRGARLLLILGAAAAGAVVAVLLAAGGRGYVLRAEFDDAAGLRKGFLVKHGGVPVGEVEDVHLGRGDRAVAELRLDDDAAPVGRDARATIRPSNLLGEKYVDLDPGDVGDPAESGFLIKRARTTTAPELDDLLAVLDGDTRAALGAFLSEQGKALVGRGGDLAAALTRMPSALDESRALVAGLARHNRALGRLVEDSDRILGAVAPERRSLGRLVRTAAGTLDTLASRRARLGETIRRAPAAIAQLRHSLVELQDAAGPLAPAARGLRATAPALTATLRELPGFATAAGPTLRTAVAVAPTLGRLGRGAAPVVRRLRPAAAELRTFGRGLEPVSELLDAGIADVLGVMQGWARATQNRDAAGHLFRADYVMGADQRRMLRDYIAGARRKRARNPRPGVKSPTVAGGAPERSLPRLELPDVPALGDAAHLPDLPDLGLPESAARTPELPDLGPVPRRRRGDSSVRMLLDFMFAP